MKILVIEDHKMIREMLAMSCAHLVPDATVRGASTGGEGRTLCRELVPDLVFLDLVLPDGDGLALVADILAAAPAARIIALTSHANEFTLHRAMQAKVHGFVDKNEQPMSVLGDAIATVMAGKQYYSSVAQRLRANLRADPAAFSKVLSEREQELLCLLGEGSDNEDIAKKIGLSPGTVKIHRRNIMAKLGIHSTPQLIRYAIEKGFSRIPDVSSV